MKKYTNAEIVAKLEEIWPAADYKVAQSEKHTDITVSQSYDSPGLSFANLNKLARFFDTLNVETESEFHHSGCETCDYGSEVGFVLRVRDGAPFEEIVNGV